MKLIDFGLLGCGFDVRPKLNRRPSSYYKTIVGLCALLSVGILQDVLAQGAATYTYDELGRIKSADYNSESAESFEYDPNGSRTLRVTTGTDPGNTPPIATDDTGLAGFTTPSNTAITFDPINNPGGLDTDANGDVLIIIALDGVVNGTAQIDSDGEEGDGTSITYSPAPDFVGLTTFNYTIADPFGATSTAAIEINVTAVGANQIPTAVDDEVSTLAGEAIVFDPTINDIDADGDELFIASVSPPSNGFVTLIFGDQEQTRLLSYTPFEGFVGTDAFEYSITDNRGGTDIGQVTVAVTEDQTPNTPPDAKDKSIVVLMDTDFVFDPRLDPNDPSDPLTNDTDIDGDPLTIISVRPGENGNAVIGDGGQTVTYTPVAGYLGLDFFSYAISDGNGGTDQAIISVDVQATGSGNVAPIATADLIAAQIDMPISFDPLANDNDPDGDPMSIRSITQPEHGDAVLHPDSTITYGPPEGFAGSDSLSYVVIDTFGAMDVGQVIITVDDGSGANLPTASDFGVTTIENTPLVIDPTGNITGEAPLIIIAVTQPVNGTAVITGNEDGSLILYTPNEGFSGSGDPFAYTIADNLGRTATGTITVTVTTAPVNVPPVAQDNEPVTIAQGVAATLFPTITDANVGDILTITAARGRPGLVVVSDDGLSIVYTPPPGFTGTMTIDYRVEDGRGGSDFGSLLVTVDPSEPGQTVFSVDDVVATEGDALAFTISRSGTTLNTQNVRFETISGDATADVDYTTVSTQISFASGDASQSVSVTSLPDTDVEDDETFTVRLARPTGGAKLGRATGVGTILDDDSPGNTPPVAQPDVITTMEGVPITFDPLANDSDVDGDPLTIISVTIPTNGVVAIDGGNNGDATLLTYTPHEGFSGDGTPAIDDSFDYSISDGNGGLATALVSVNVDPLPANAPPVPSNPSELTTPVNTPLLISVATLGSDPDTDPIRVASVREGVGGSVRIEDGGVTYFPHEGFDGTDSFQYVLSDDKGALSATGMATVTVTVPVPTNNPPVANDDPDVVTQQGVSIIYDPRWNDFDPDSDPLTIISAISRIGARIDVAEDGQSLNYIPIPEFTGNDEVLYSIADGQGGTASATIFIQVNEDIGNQAPTAVDDFVATLQDNAVTFEPLLNDSDPDDDPLAITAVGEALNGSVTFSRPDEDVTTITYTPNEGFTGADSFTYTISDPDGATSTATVTVSVAEVGSEGPTAVIDLIVTDQDVPVTFDPRANDLDNGNPPLTIISVTQGAAGFVTIGGEADGTELTYAPNPGSTADDSFTYTIVDALGGTDTGTVSVTVNAVGANTPPVAVNDNIATAPSVSLTFDPRLNDSDTDGDPLTIESARDGLNGTVTINSNGLTVTYTPNEGFVGDGTSAPDDSFEYVISDGQGGTAMGTVSVDVEAGNTGNSAPTVINDSATALPDTPVVIDVLLNDSDPEDDAISIFSTTDGSNGTAVHDGALVTYTPNTGFLGTDSFTYTVRDIWGAATTGQVNVTVEDTGTGNQPPVANPLSVATQPGVPITFDPRIDPVDPANNDFDPEGGPVFLAFVFPGTNGTTRLEQGDQDQAYAVTYTPNPGFTDGTDSFIYTISDDQGATASATVTVTVSGNQAPVAVDDTIATGVVLITGLIDPITFDPRLNDSDPDLDMLVIVAAQGGENGQIMINNGGTSLTYTPNLGFEGLDSLQYVIADPLGSTDSATVEIIVADGQSGNKPPVAVDDLALTDAGQVVLIDPTTNDNDPDGDPLTITSVTQGANGTVSHDGTIITYTPNAGFFGTDTISYIIVDPGGASDTADIVIAVSL